jgi:hypothetical protein
MATMLQFAQKNVNSWKNRNLQRTAQQREDSSSVVSGKTKVRFTTFTFEKLYAIQKLVIYFHFLQLAI